MSDHPYKNLPITSFWSSGVKSPVSAKELLAIDPLLNSLAANDSIVSGGSCFAQYIGKELGSRKFDYLRSKLSGDRIESFGLGNIYTIAQLKQWLEFSLGHRAWAEECVFETANQWYDLLLPHRGAMPSKKDLEEHRVAIKDEMLNYLKRANVFIFTIGLTETWRNQNGDIYPTCPGTIIGEFDNSKHFFHNCTFADIHADLKTVENMLADINPGIGLVYTVSPVPLTATASGSHVLMATTYSKSVIRAAVGEYCNSSQCASYFPSYELINHHDEADWRFENNLRSISDSGVRYVMGHAFGEVHKLSRSCPPEKNTQTCDPIQEAICEEELLENYAKLAGSVSSKSDILIVGDCHMGKLASGFETAGVEVIGGMVMHGSAFIDENFELTDECIFVPLETGESMEIWLNIHDKLKSLNGCCQIITNIGFQTHITINRISNHFGTAVITEKNIADYFDKYFVDQVHILRELTKLGKVWMVEDPDFHAFIGNKDNTLVIRDKNFHQYCQHMRTLAQKLGIEYLNPCDTALQNLFKNSKGIGEIIDPSGLLGTQSYYEYCATVVNASIGDSIAVTERAA